MKAAIAKPVAGDSAILAASPDGTRRALFLDRDGIVNVNHGYVHTAAATVVYDSPAKVESAPGGVDPASPEGPGLAAKYLLAYEACFRNLGDMNAGPED